MKLLILTIGLLFLGGNIGFTQENKLKEKSEKLSEKAAKSFTKGKIEKAVQLYTVAIRLDSTNADAYYGRGNSYAAQDDNEKALADYDRAIALNKNNDAYFWARGTIYFERENYKQALIDFEENEAPNRKLDKEQKELLVQTYLYNSQISEALSYLTQLIEAYPSQATYYSQRATCYLSLGLLKETHHDLQKLEELKDDSNERYKLETLFYMQTKNAVMAIESARKNIRPNDSAFLQAEGYQLLSNVYYSIQFSDSAMATINRAIELAPQAPYYFDRACYLADAGEIDRALTDFNETIRLDSTHIGAYNNRTFYIWFPAKKFDNAIEDLSKIIALDSLNAFAYSNRSYAYYSVKAYDLAFDDAMKSFELEPRNPYVYKNLALIYFAKGDTTEAKSMVQNALEWGFPAETDPEFLMLVDYFNIAMPNASE